MSISVRRLMRDRLYARLWDNDALEMAMVRDRVGVSTVQGAIETYSRWRVQLIPEHM